MFSATAYASRGSSQAGFVNVRAGQEARFLGTHVTCVAPKGQIPGGQVGCAVSYAYWRNISHPVATKYEVSLSLLKCIEVEKWSRKLLKSRRLC